MSKGKPTADFVVDHKVIDGILRVTIEANATVDDHSGAAVTVRGTTELSNLIKVIGKDATPITASERRDNAKIKFFMDTLGYTEDAAVKLAEQQAAAIANA